MSQSGPRVCGRFAPSPSGRMHLGNAFSALLAWLSVRSQGGRMLLRIEDLDPDRCRPEYTAQLIDDLRWLGLDWDASGPEYAQSARGAYYLDALERLERRGLIYPCFCSRAELHAASAPHASDGRTVYSGACRALSAQEICERAKKRTPALRLRVPDREIAFTDGLLGPYSQNLARDCGDFILRRSDGVFAYQLAVVTDDARMGVTQVVRGRDLLESTPRQLYLYELLGFPPPEFYHIPLLLAPDGRRLAKRERHLDFGALRKRCPRPEALVGYLASLAGLLPHPEPISAAELIPLFGWDRIRREDIQLGTLSMDTTCT